MHRSLALVLLCASGCLGEVIEGTGALATTATTGGTTMDPGGTDTTGTSSTDAPTTAPTTEPSTEPTTDPASTEPGTSTGLTSTGPDTTTGEPCGNGMVDPGEQCDDGNRLQGDDCTNACTRAGSCLELLMLDAALPDGAYTIDPDGDGTTLMVTCDMAGGGWTQVVAEDLDAPEGWAGGGTTSQCGGIGSLLGGAGQLGAGATLSKSFALFGVEHTSLRASAAVAIIDSWDTNETMILEVDSMLVADKSCVHLDPASCNQVEQLCGEPTMPDGEIVLTGEIMHATDAALVKLSTTLNEPANNESWGLNTLLVYVR